MGQYYKPVIINEDNQVTHWWYTHDCKSSYKTHNGEYVTTGSGLKLMEHSWRRNNFVSQVSQFLLNNPQRLVWAGDYADKEKGIDANLYDLAVDKLQVDIPHFPLRVRGKKVGEFGNYIYVAPHADMSIRYAVNFDKKEFVAFDKLPKDADDWKMHALPILTCEGNGRGGGDYHEENDNLIGTWARDRIATCRLKKDVPKDFTEIFPQFCE